MDTFEYYYKNFRKFEDKILSWKPDYIVPVAKKGCKLLKASNQLGGINPSLIKYKTYFELNNISPEGKKVSIVDDATQFTSTLQEYRIYFENLGAEVRTFSFIGHEYLYEGKKWKYDEKAEIEYFLSDPVYHEYILQQSYFLLENGNQYDLDHLVFEVDLLRNNFDVFKAKLKTLGLLLHLEDYFLREKTKRFSLISPSFFDKLPFFSDASVSLGPILKIKFIYNPETEKLYFSPLVFPIWDFKKTKLKSTDFNDVPFKLPFTIPSTYDNRNKNTLLRIYYNLQFAHIGGFAKAFVDQLPSFNLHSSLKIKDDDLNAILGIEDTRKFITSLKDYVCHSNKLDFSSGVIPQKLSVTTRSRYKSFGDVLDHMKKTYENMCRREKKRIGIHYYLSYEKLFSWFQDEIYLSENLDYYCDFGVIVPETLIRDGKVQRYCRTGEPNSEYNWSRTQVLIPLVIELFKKEFGGNTIEPMLLNKLLSNFTYDYPSDYYHELHCLIGEPYIFGTLVRAYHYHRATRKPSIYKPRRISPYYGFDEEGKLFYTINLPEFTKKISYLFDERQEISYSEITTYFKFLLKIYKHSKKVDVLNMLSICRDESYFYSHILYNIRIWIEIYGNYLDEKDEKEKDKLVHQTGTHANSSWDKLELAENLPETLNEIKKTFGTDLDSLKTLDRILKNNTTFSSQFQETFKRLKKIVILELILTNLSLYHFKPNKKYKGKLNELKATNVLAEHTLNIPEDFVFSSTDEFLIIAKRIYNGIKKIVDTLPREETPLLSTRLKNESLQRAKNIATGYVCTQELSEATILFLDLSGLRTIPEPKETVISEYYRITEENARQRSGIKLYGGKDGDDAFSFLFCDIAQAIQCANDIKRDFTGNLFLSANSDIKFGICAIKFFDDKDKRETQIIQCWGLAKDCCEFKGGTLRNKGNLLISQETFDFLLMNNNSLADDFIKIDGENLKNENSSAIYKFIGIEPIK